ncbi:MAG: hypothetical protein ABIQ70_13665 [Dokdonella sp.]
MPDRGDTVNANPEHALAQALRALPDAAPQPDLWPELAQALASRRKPRAWHYAIPLALAAGLACALLLPRGTLQLAQPETTPHETIAASAPDPAASHEATSANADELDNLHQRSQTLERWIAAVAARAPQDSRDLMAAVEMEDLIGLVDVQLGAVHDHNDALSLWRQRVALLEDLATIRGSAFAIASNDNEAARAAATSLDSIN